MFEDSLFATNPRRDPRKRWAALLSFALQAALVTVLVVLPLFFTEALPLDVRTVISVPMPAAAKPPGQPPEAVRHQRSESNLDQEGRVIAIREIPKYVKRYVDEIAPPPIGENDGVVGVPPGTGTPDGVMGSVLRDINRVVAVPKPAPLPKPVIVSHMDEGMLIRKVTPQYPQIARIAHQQGTVELHAIIGRDGTVRELQAVSGPPLLVRAAIDAVSQWRYRPYILNGQPVEVETRITVNFKLGG